MSKQTLVMVWRPDKKSDSEHKVVYLDFGYFAEGDKIKYHVHGCWTEDENNELADLRIRAQANMRDPDHERKFYGWDIQYYPYSVDWRRAKIMVKTLADLHKKLTKYETEWGSVLTFGAYVQRIGKVFGVKHLIHYTRQPGWDWNDNGEYVTKAWRDAATTIDWLAGNEIHPQIETFAA